MPTLLEANLISTWMFIASEFQIIAAATASLYVSPNSQ